MNDPRPVTVATASVSVPGRPNDPEAYREASFDLIRQAGERGADVVCLPEFTCSRHMEGDRFEPEPVPGAASTKLGELARAYHMWVIGCLLEKADDGRCYNTALLFGRDGHLAGRYRKTHLCHRDCGEGERVAAGDEVPVFRTDFGTIAITVCFDIHFPELYRAMADQGAEIFFWPSAAIDYTGELIEHMVNTRAVDNQAYVVTSHTVATPYLVGRPYGRSRIVDCMGRTRADTGHFPGLAIARIDLAQTYPTWYAGVAYEKYPTMRELFRRHRRPELYGCAPAAPNGPPRAGDARPAG